MKIITLLGQTSSGKTQLSLEWYHQIINSGEKCVIINCDSRQIYKGLDIGTGKISGAWREYNGHPTFMAEKAPHYLIDHVEPARRYSMADYLKDWCNLFSNELRNFDGTVILVGGTGLWAKAINDELQPGIIKSEFVTEYESIKSNIQNLSKEKLQSQLNKSDFNRSDWNNPRRLINAILRKKIIDNNWEEPLDYPQFDSKTLAAITIDQPELEDKIAQRLQTRFESGLLPEIEKNLHLGDRLLELGLEYRLGYLFLLGQLTKEEFQQKLIRENIQYAKRQLTWLKKQPVTWISPTAPVSQINTPTT